MTFWRADEHITTICLTHAQFDHYRSLGANLQDGAPVYAATDTADILADVFAAGEAHNYLPNTDAVLDRLHPIDEWTQVAPGVRGRGGYTFEAEKNAILYADPGNSL